MACIENVLSTLSYSFSLTFWSHILHELHCVQCDLLLSVWSTLQLWWRTLPQTSANNLRIPEIWQQSRRSGKRRRCRESEAWWLGGLLQDPQNTADSAVQTFNKDPSLLLIPLLLSIRNTSVITDWFQTFLRWEICKFCCCPGYFLIPVDYRFVDHVIIKKIRWKWTTVCSVSAVAEPVQLTASEENILTTLTART